MYTLSIETVQSLLIKHDLLREVIIGEDWHYRLNDKEQLAMVIKDITYHSGESRKNSLFFCKGKNFKEAYLLDALENGTEFYISEKIYDTTTGVGFIVSDIRKAMAILSRAFYGYPDKELSLIGVTGTKGKTTTTFLIQQMLENAFPGKVGYTSSIDNHYDGKHYEPASLTTPESLDLFKIFAKAVENNLSYFIMEVSSQAYKLDRVYGITFDYGVFLNFSPDHISEFEHPTLEDYLFCKRQLLMHSKHSIIYSGSPHVDLLEETATVHSEKSTTYGNDDGSDIVVARDGEDSHKFSIYDTEVDQTETFTIGLPGDFNKLNAAAAFIIGKDMGIKEEAIEEAILETTVPGRMEKITMDNDVTVFIDFAHNYLSIKTLLEFLTKEYPDSHVIAVAGGPGSRGEERLLGMADVFSNYGDIVYITSDNPDFDDPSYLAHLIADNIEGERTVIIENDREKAITQAVSSAKPGDVVAVMGKGSENYQIIEGKNVPYIGDKQVVLNYMESLEK